MERGKVIRNKRVRLNFILVSLLTHEFNTYVEVCCVTAKMIALRNCGIKNVGRLKFGKHLYPRQSPRMLLERFYQDDGKERRTATDKQQIPSAISDKYQVFRDEDAAVILDVEEERLKHLETVDLSRKQYEDEFSGLNLESKYYI